MMTNADTDFSDRSFPMPETVPAKSPYIPRQKPDIFSDTSHALVTHALGSRTKIDEIKATVRMLLHREMRDLVKEIFEAHAKLPRTETTTSRNPAITATELADVLDKFAFGD